MTAKPRESALQLQLHPYFKAWWKKKKQHSDSFIHKKKKRTSKNTLYETHLNVTYVIKNCLLRTSNGWASAVYYTIMFNYDTIINTVHKNKKRITCNLS